MTDRHDHDGPSGPVDEGWAADHEGAVAVVDAPRRPLEHEARDPEQAAAPVEPGAAPDAEPTPLQRVGARVVRRPVRWARRPWTTARIVQVAITAATLLVTTVVMLNVVHLNPLNPAADLIFDRTTPTGGDMGAHVWGPAFLRDHLLGSLQLSGWSMDWYAGMPVYRFYMVVPALAIVALDVVAPYGVAFKLVAVSGLVTFPAACWAFGRLARFRYPIPELFAFAGLCFVLDESFSIYGGNLKSTMAGEFSFSIALTLGMVGLGLLANSMQTGRYRIWTAVVLALAIVSHGIVAIYLAVAALVIVLVNTDSARRLRHGATVGVAVVLLSLFWIGPFLRNHEYMTDMKYGARPDGPNDSFWDMFFPLAAPLDIAITALAVVGFVACVARRHVNGTALGVIGMLTVAGVYLTQDSLPVIGLLWNPRLLPLLYLVRYLLMMIGIVEVAGVMASLWRDRSARTPADWRVGSVTAGAVGLTVLIVLGFMFEVLPGGGRRQPHDTVVYAWGPFRKTATAGDAQGDGWSRYNFTGYEGRTAYPEYYDLVQAMARIGATQGCGRATWENNEENGQYGTTMALMLLPHWTDGCIGSMEGLFFEASGTTPYHFLATAAMSENSSNPVRELRYVDNDAAVGVAHLQTLGVRYAMVRTDAAKREAAAQPELELLDTVGPWEIYLVADSAVVEPLSVQPVVVEGRPGDQRERHLELGTSWFQNRDEWAAIPADSGPDSWQRISVGVDETRRVPDPNRPADDPDGRGKQVDIVVPEQPIEPVALPAVSITDVQMDQQELSFRVDQVGVPVLVKVSYFPNWSVDGAAGPFRVAPNFMVVVPTDTEVRLHYDRRPSDLLFSLLTVAGIAMLVLMRRRGDVDLDPAVVAGGDADPTAPLAAPGDDVADATTAPLAGAGSEDDVVDDVAHDHVDGVARDDPALARPSGQPGPWPPGR